MDKPAEYQVMNQRGQALLAMNLQAIMLYSACLLTLLGAHFLSSGSHFVRTAAASYIWYVGVALAWFFGMFGFAAAGGLKGTLLSLMDKPVAWCVYMTGVALYAWASASAFNYLL